jgi:hypothetical protein
VPSCLFIFALWLTAVFPAEAPVPDARALMQGMHRAETENRRQAAYFVYREEIRFWETVEGGPVRSRDWVSYELTMLEGESYHRRVAINGHPLDPDEEEAEEKRYREVERYRRATPLEERRRKHLAAEERRFKIDTRIVMDFHDMKLLGEATHGGRKVWVVETMPRKGAPKPKRRSEWSLSQRLKYWIDEQTFLPLEVEAEQLFDFDSSRKGTVTRVTYKDVDGVSLLQRIHSSGVRKSGKLTVTAETDQTYSNYRRFRSESVLWFNDDPAAKR